jgi:hypothetical protein
VQSLSAARPCSYVTDIEDATPLSVVAENTRGHLEVADDLPIPPQNHHSPARRCTADVPLLSGEDGLELDSNMQDTQPYGLSFPLPDVSYLFQWMPQTGQAPPSAGQHYSPLELGILPPPQLTSIISTPQSLQVPLRAPHGSGRRTFLFIP